MHNLHKLCKKETKMGFLAIFSSLVHWFDLILHILIGLNGVHELAIVSPMVDHSKSQLVSLLFFLLSLLT